MNTTFQKGIYLISIREDLTGTVTQFAKPGVRPIEFKLRKPLSSEEPWYLPVTSDPLDKIILSDINRRVSRGNNSHRQLTLFEGAA